MEVLKPDYLLKQAEKLLVAAQQKYQPEDRVRCLVLYDPVTHEPLPGYEPDPRATAIFYLPYNGRDALPGPYIG